MAIKLSAFKFTLPDNLIALHPIENRDEARLMIVHKQTGKIEHKQFKDILTYFNEKDTLVINDTKVFAAKLFGNKEKTGAKIEIILLRNLNEKLHLWDVIVDPARKIRVGNKLYFGNGELVAEVLDNTTSRGRTLKFLFNGTLEDFLNVVDKIGYTPIPSNITRSIIQEDKNRYQTVYAKNIGAVVAPMAGLHFTPHLLKRLEIQGVNIAPITLHTGLGTLRNINVEDLTKYRIDSENFIINKQVADTVNTSLDHGNKIFVVGVNTTKILESSISTSLRLKPNEGWSNKFIMPPCDFHITSALITNFQLPESILLINVAAFTGYDLLMHAYQEAIKEKYRFFVYGDAMLVI